MVSPGQHFLRRNAMRLSRSHQAPMPIPPLPTSMWQRFQYCEKCSWSQASVSLYASSLIMLVLVGPGDKCGVLSTAITRPCLELLVLRWMLGSLRYLSINRLLWYSRTPCKPGTQLKPKVTCTLLLVNTKQLGSLRCLAVLQTFYFWNFGYNPIRGRACTLWSSTLFVLHSLKWRVKYCFPGEQAKPHLNITTELLALTVQNRLEGEDPGTIQVEHIKGWDVNSVDPNGKFTLQIQHACKRSQ
mmetsp:Transcript_18781/g.43973  ORF Transcript_18781/g.43973 Transcript_18781/m.43973 type:complete len:243 (+) Transcript_18781:1465-2193(+)